MLVLGTCFETMEVRHASIGRALEPETGSVTYGSKFTIDWGITFSDTGCEHF